MAEAEKEQQLGNPNQREPKPVDLVENDRTTRTFVGTVVTAVMDELQAIGFDGRLHLNRQFNEHRVRQEVRLMFQRLR